MRRTILLAIVAASVLLSGCERKNSSKSKSTPTELLLYCGAGIRPPAAELAEAFEREHKVKVVTDYAGSEVLLSKIKLVQQGDLYMPGDKHYVDQAAQAGMILSQRPVCYFVPTILVQKGNPKGISGLTDLLKPGLKLGVGDPKACAIGRTTMEILAKNNIDQAQIESNLKFQSQTVNELGMQIQAKALDAVIVWDAMANYYREHGDQIPIPAQQNVISTVDVAVLKFSENKDLAEKFVEFAASQKGKEIFERNGYRTEPP
jgi:molybdate transport system substrate-binding protein